MECIYLISRIRSRVQSFAVQQPFLWLIVSGEITAAPGPRHEVWVPAVAPVPVCAILELARGLRRSQGPNGQIWANLFLSAHETVIFPTDLGILNGILKKETSS